MLYALSQLGHIWQRADLLDLAETRVAQLAEKIVDDKKYDIIAGSAGAIAGLLSLYAVRPSKQTLETAERCAHHLLAQADRQGATFSWATQTGSNVPLSGFSHGAAGIAHAFAALFRSTGKSSYLAAAQAAVAFERTLYCAPDQNWLDQRDLPEEITVVNRRCAITWCHGAPGIGLARLNMLGLGDDTALVNEIRAAVASTLKGGFGYNHSLCHGDLGNLELIAEAARRLDDPAIKQQADLMTSHIFHGIQQQGYRSGIATREEVPGLMNGLAGIGYGLLRLAAPDQVPSVLTLQAPVKRAAAVQAPLNA